MNLEDASKTPLFTVVIPTYNRTSRILPTLGSVKEQTCQDFECLVIDDGSVDGDKLAAIIDSLDDDRFRYIRQENGGASSARNRGFDVARGRYIALLDSDDRFLPTKLEKMALALSEVRGDALAYSQMLVERGLDKKWVRPPRGLKLEERVDEYLLCTAGTIRTSTVVATATLARKVRFDEALPSLQDTDFAIRAADSGATVLFLAEPLIAFEDQVGYARVSRNADYQPLLNWLDRLRGRPLSERAYWAGRGWQCARIASYSNRPLAISLFIRSAVRGVFPPRQAIVIAAQVVIPYRIYQWTANRVVALLGKRSRE